MRKPEPGHGPSGRARLKASPVAPDTVAGLASFFGGLHAPHL